jgi:hypothetical protein
MRTVGILAPARSETSAHAGPATRESVRAHFDRELYALGRRLAAMYEGTVHSNERRIPRGALAATLP